MFSSWNKRQLILTLIFLGAIVYLNALGNQLFWDDHDGIVNNAYIKDWSYLPRYFSENLIAGAGLQSNYWRPILLIVFSVGWKIWGLWPAGFHLISIGVHLLAGWLIFELFFLLTKKHWLAFFPALFFLIHPLQTEAVTYVSGLADPLSAVFILLGLLFYLKKREENILWPTWIFFVLALMTKEKALIIFPTLLFLLELALFVQENPEKISFSAWKDIFLSLFKKFWPMFAVGSFYVLLRATSLNFQNTFNLYDQSNLYADSIFIRTWTFLKIFPAYLGLIFWPFNLHMERLVEINPTFFSWPVILGFSFLGGLFFRLFSQVRKNPLIAFSLGWFLSTLLASSGIPAVSSGIMYEHYLYLPLTGFFLWLGLEVEQIIQTRKIPTLIEKSGLILLLVFILFFSVLTIRRNRVWRNPIIFYENVLQYNQTSLRVWNNLGMAYADANQIEKAAQAYRKAIELDPEKSSAPPRHNLANALAALGKKDEAIALLKENLELNPQFVFSYGTLAQLMAEKGQAKEASTFFEKIKQKAPEKKWELDAVIKWLDSYDQ